MRPPLAILADKPRGVLHFPLAIFIYRAQAWCNRLYKFDVLKESIWSVSDRIMDFLNPSIAEKYVRLHTKSAVANVHSRPRIDGDLRILF